MHAAHGERAPDGRRSVGPSRVRADASVRVRLMQRVPFDEAVQRAAAALARAGANDEMALSTARALVLAEAQGIASHGLGRVAQYANHLRNGRADGEAIATVVREHGATLLVDAMDGLAFPACELAVANAVDVASRLGVCFAGVANSHH